MKQSEPYATLKVEMSRLGMTLFIAAVSWCALVGAGTIIALAITFVRKVL